MADITSNNGFNLGLNDAPATPKPKKGDFGSMFDQSLNSALQTSLTPEPMPKGIVGMGVAYADPNQLDNFRYQEGFQGQNFNPFDASNNDKWAAKETWNSALGKAFDDFSYKFGNSFSEWYKSYGRMGDAILSMDWDKLRPDEQTVAETYYQDQINQKKNFVFMKPEDEENLFSKRTMAEFVGNAGFALGTFAGLGLELAADAAVTYLTGGAGAGSFAATFGRVAGKEALKEGAEAAAKGAVRSSFDNVAKGAADFFRGASLADRSADEIKAAANIFKQMEQASAISTATRSQVAETMKATFEAFNNSLLSANKFADIGKLAGNLAKEIPVLGTGVKFGERIALAAKGGASGATLAGMGAQGLRRMAQELNMSASEASFEAVTTYGDTLDKMMQQHLSDNDGMAPDFETWNQMKAAANKASAANYNTNMALLMASNKIQFGNLFNKFTPANRYMSELYDVFVKEGSEDILKVSTKGAASKLYRKGMTGAYGVLGKVAKDFGKKEAVYQFGKAFAKDALKFEITEGLQENLQETSAAAWRDYYAGQVNGVKMSLSEAAGKGMEEQFSKQGLKTFLMGALTGSIIRLPTSLATRSVAKVQQMGLDAQYKGDDANNPQKRADKALDDSISTLNSFFKQAYDKKFEDKIFNFTNQSDAAQQQAQAATSNLRYEFENGGDNALLSAVLTAKSVGSFDMLEKAVSSMGENMSADDFEKSFGIKLSDTKYANAREFSESVARDMRKYGDAYEQIYNQARANFQDPSTYAKGSSAQYIASIVRAAQEDAVKVLAMNQMKGNMAKERAEKIASKFSAIPGIANSSDFALRVMTNPTLMDNEDGNIALELRNLQDSLAAEGLDPVTRRKLEEQIESKQNELQLLAKWKSFWSTRDQVMGTTESGEQVTAKVPDTFTGKKFKARQVTTNADGTTSEEEVDAFDATDPEVMSVFAELMNIKNKQAGIDTQINAQDVQSAYSDFVDFLQLNGDAKDYLRSADALTNSENFRQMYERMLDGRYKKDLIAYLDMLDENLSNLGIQFLFVDLGIRDFDKLNSLLKEIDDTVKASEPFKNLMQLIADPTFGHKNADYADKQREALREVINKKLQDLRDQYGPKDAEDIDDAAYEAFKSTGQIDDSYKELIAQRIFKQKPLLTRMKNVYETFKDDIRERVARLQKEYEEQRKNAAQKTYTQSAAGSTVTKGTQGTKPYLMAEDRRFAEDILADYDMQDQEVRPLKEIVQKAIDNPLTHPVIKEALQRMVGKIKDDAQFKMDRQQSYAPGYFDAERNTVVLDPDLHNAGTTSFEAVLLHELIHYFTAAELKNADSPFTQQMQTLFDQTTAYLQAQGADTGYYGFSNLDEFVAEAFSNADFQEELARIPGTSNTSVWQTFVSQLLQFLRRTFGNNFGNENMLNDVLNEVSTFIDGSTAMANPTPLPGAPAAPAETGTVEETAMLFLTPEELQDVEAEYQPGDYIAVAQLANDQVNGRAENTPENQQLLTNYPKLFEKLMQKYMSQAPASESETAPEQERQADERTVRSLQGTEVSYNGTRGILTITEGGVVSIETPNMIIDLEGVTPDSTLSEAGISDRSEEAPILEVATDRIVSEDRVILNEVEYQIVTGPNGNVVGLRPSNRPRQVLRNERLLIKAEILRNTLEYAQVSDVVTERTTEAVQQEIDKIDEARAVQTVLEYNFTDTIAEALDKLYEAGGPETLTAAEKLQTELWVFDALDRMDELVSQYPDNEIFRKSFEDLLIINELLHNEKTKPGSAATTGGQQPSPTKQKRTAAKRNKAKSGQESALSRKTQEPAAPLVQGDLFSAAEQPQDSMNLDADTQLLNQLMGRYETAEETPPTAPQAPKGDAFTPQSTEEGFAIADRQGDVISEERYTDEEAARQKAEELSQNRRDLEFITQLLEGVAMEDSALKTAQLYNKAVASMKSFNKRNGTSFTSLEEYYKTPKGRKNINQLKKNILTPGTAAGTTTESASAPAVMATDAVPVSFDTTTAQGAATLTLDGLKQLDAKVAELGLKGLQDSEKVSKFVESSTPQTSVTESSILDELRKITGCFE